MRGRRGHRPPDRRAPPTARGEVAELHCENLVFGKFLAGIDSLLSCFCHSATVGISLHLLRIVNCWAARTIGLGEPASVVQERTIQAWGDVMRGFTDAKLLREARR